MLSTFAISFREFLEAFLIIGVFLGISRKLELKKEFEIGLAAIIGIAISLLFTTVIYLFNSQIREILTENKIELIENYLMIFSGIFIIYTTISLHKLLHKIQVKNTEKVNQKIHNNIFDVSLFFTIIFLVFREGFEIALFTASTSLLSIFIQNFSGLILGFIFASVFGFLIFFTYLKFSIKKILKITEYFILLLGVLMTVNGLIKLIFH